MGSGLVAGSQFRETFTPEYEECHMMRGAT